jgi:DNA-binding transcriptional ArsR family regulator
VAFFSEVVQVFGVPKSVGQIYGLLYATSEPLSFSDIVERLDISKGSASQGLRVLRSLGAVNVVQPSAILNLESQIKRSVVYEPELSLRKLVSGVLQERITPLAAAGADRLARLRELAQQDRDGNEFYLDRANQLNSWRRRLKTVLPMLNLLLGPKRRK